jgi:hypothetical protein
MLSEIYLRIHLNRRLFDIERVDTISSPYECDCHGKIIITITTSILKAQCGYDQMGFTSIKYAYLMDHSPINQNFELNKSRQKFHHSLKEHHKISHIPKFRWKML